MPDGGANAALISSSGKLMPLNTRVLCGRDLKKCMALKWVNLHTYLYPHQVVPVGLCAGTSPFNNIVPHRLQRQGAANTAPLRYQDFGKIQTCFSGNARWQCCGSRTSLP